MEISVDDPTAADVRALLERHLAFSRATTPLEFSFALDVGQLTGPDITFFSARRDGELLGVAALRRLDESHVELKSMHTRQEARGQGVARALLVELIATARRHGYRRMSLETGTTDDFEAARRLYLSAGFEPCEPYGTYQPSPHNAWMTLVLDPSRDATDEDAAELVRLRALMFESMGLDTSGGWKAHCERWILRHLGDDLFGAVVDAPDGQGLAATGLVQISDRVPTPSLPSGRHAYINSISTDGRWRRRGYAEAVMCRLLDRLGEQGVDRVELHATPDAEHLYRRLGFVERAGGLEMRLATRPDG